MGEDLDMRDLPSVETLEEGSYLFGEVGGEVVKVPASEVGGGGSGGTVSDNYVFTNDGSEEETPEVDEPILNADRLQGYKADDFVKKDSLEVLEFTAESDGVGLIGTGLSTKKYFIIGAHLVSPKIVEQADIIISVNPSSETYFLTCSRHKNETITIKALAYKYA